MSTDWDEDDWDEPDEDWTGDEEDVDVVECPNCGAEVYEEAERCPVCGEYITHGRHPLSGRPAWYVVLGVVGLIIAAMMLLVV